MKNSKVLFLLFLGITGMLISCEEQGPEYIEDYDLVITNHDENFAFKEAKYYSVLDTVVHLVPSDFNDKINRKFDDLMLSQVESEMDNLGYTKVSEINEDDADIIITVSALSTTYISGGYYDPSYWWNYWDWYNWYPYYPGIGPGWSPWYGYYPTYYVWDEGTVLIEMMDLNNINEEEKQIPVVWNATLNGLLMGSDENIEGRLEENISQAFKQSDYLGIN